MAITNVELYEALKPSVGEEAAKMMAEVIPPAADIATKTDIAGLSTRMDQQIADLSTRMDQLGARMDQKIADLSARMDRGFAELRSEIHAGDLRTIKWIMGVFIPVWASTWATMIALFLKH